MLRKNYTKILALFATASIPMIANAHPSWLIDAINEGDAKGLFEPMMKGQGRTLTVEQDVSHGYYAGTPTPYCIADKNVFDVVHTVAAYLSASSGDKKEQPPSFLGSLLAVINRYQNEIRGGVQLQGWLNETLTAIYGDESARCAPLTAVLPAGSRILNVQYSAADGFGDGPCTPDGNQTDGKPWFVCSIGWSKFVGQPTITPAGNSMLVTGLFMNWSHDRPRTMRMTITYVPPEWWNQ